MNFRQFVEMNRSPVKAYFLLVKTGNMWGVYLEDPLGETKFLFNKMASFSSIMNELSAWAESNHYDSFNYRIENGIN